MRQIFFLVLLFITTGLFAQAPANYTNINGRYRWIAGMFDSTFHIPKGTTTSLRTGGSTNAGALFYRTTDSSVYYYTGTQWLKVAGAAGFVPYTGATQNVNLGQFGLTTKFVQFDTSSQAVTDRRLQWSNAEGTLQFGMTNGSTITQRIGLEQFARVRNLQGDTIEAGDVVYISGASGDRAAVKLADNRADSTSSKTLGVATEQILPNDLGLVGTFGVVGKLNLSAFTAGDVVYLDSIPGKLTKVKPQAPYHMVFVGVVERANAGNGLLFVNVQNGYELEELHNVRITSPVRNNAILAYDSVGRLWKDTTLNAIGGITGSGTSGQVSYFNGTNSITSSPTFAFTPTSQLLVNNSVTASSSIARGINATPTLTAAANGDALVGLDITPTFTNGAFTGVSNLALRVQNGNGLLSWNQNATTELNISNTTSGTNSQATLKATSSGGNIQLGKYSATTTAYKIISSNNGFIYNSTSDLAILADQGGSSIKMTANGATLPHLQIFSTGNVGISQTTDAGFRLDVNGTVRFGANLTANDVLGYLNFRNGSNAAYIMQENSTSRSIQIPGTGGNSHWIFNNSGAGWGLQGSFANGTFLTRGDLITFTNANFAGNSLQVIGINGTQAGDNRNIYIGNNGAQYANEKGTNIRLIAGIGGTSGGDRVGGDIFLTPGPGGGAARSGYVVLAHTGTATQGNVGVGTATPVASALVDITSTTKGFLPPRMTTAQRDAISTPATGLSVYNTSTSTNDYYNGSAWLNIGQVLAPANNTTGFSISGSSLTGSNAQSLVSLSQTWNTTGNPTAFLLNITNTASGATADLMELQVGGVAQFIVGKSGTIQTTAPAGGTAKPWKLGNVAVVSPTSPDRTIEVEIDGVTYYIHAKTTNN